MVLDEGAQFKRSLYLRDRVRGTFCRLRAGDGRRLRSAEGTPPLGFASTSAASGSITTSGGCVDRTTGVPGKVPSRSVSDTPREKGPNAKPLVFSTLAIDSVGLGDVCASDLEFATFPAQLMAFRTALLERGHIAYALEH